MHEAAAAALSPLTGTMQSNMKRHRGPAGWLESRVTAWLYILQLLFEPASSLFFFFFFSF